MAGEILVRPFGWRPRITSIDVQFGRHTSSCYCLRLATSMVKR